MARSQIRSAEALKKMRERQRELDREDDQQREARRERIAEASASALVALGRYDKTVEAVDDATAEVVTAVRTLLAAGVDVDRAAALLELDAAEVRRFSKAANKPAETKPASATAGDAAGEATVMPMSGRGAGKQTAAASSGASVGDQSADAERRTG
jgi:hypothetical protein